MSVEEIERRWSSLRVMFSRENRRQMLPPSGSGYESRKEWELYRNMLFLVPHIAHRKTKTLFVQQSQSLLPQTSTTDTSSPFTSKQSSNVITLLPDHSYSGSFQSIKENTLSLDLEDQESNITITDCEIPNRPASTLSSCSYTSSVQSLEPNTSFNPTQLKDSSVFKSTKKVMPEMDEFAKL
ncbi:PREDICTED: uncharacterized protein LOC108761624 [Trachymyrmex cornetzi]|uniref:uncharacterized protein LOC108761624 n=1 Tax=Trachymyrmex cornetzi TaxID=471704 RepID=UPI00084F315B|nr:PREDICTED: uncharacterized protein LOC108761624 [Trachymyrmex cornetzi]